MSAIESISSPSASAHILVDAITRLLSLAGRALFRNSRVYVGSSQEGLSRGWDPGGTSGHTGATSRPNGKIGLSIEASARIEYFDLLNSSGVDKTGDELNFPVTLYQYTDTQTEELPAMYKKSRDPVDAIEDNYYYSEAYLLMGDGHLYVKTESYKELVQMLIENDVYDRREDLRLMQESDLNVAGVANAGQATPASHGPTAEELRTKLEEL